MQISFKLLLPIVAMSLAFASCTKDNTNNNTNTNNNNNSQNLNSQDRTFMMKVAQGNRAEIDLGSVAAGRSADTAVQNFALMMVNDHTKAQGDLKVLTSNKSVGFADSVDAKHKALKVQLSNMTGRQFDSAYVMNMVLDHQQTDSLFAAEQSGGSDADVKAYANKYRPAIQMHLQDAKTLSTKFK
jgi:putative membrane protein